MRRVRYALFSTAVAALLVLLMSCHPLCAHYTSVWDPLYWLYSCNECPPPPPEG